MLELFQTCLIRCRWRLGDYAQSNLICYTVPRGMVIGEDLGLCATNIYHEMNSMDWLHSPIVLAYLSR